MKNKYGWEIKNFESCLEKVSYPNKIKSNNYLIDGKYPIVSQDDNLICGFWNEESDVLNIEKSVVVFGDHTRALKYIDFDFVVGADGVRVLLPKSFMNTKFLYYFLKWVDVPSLGYSRHYKLLKELDVPIPLLPIQHQIVSELDTLSDIITKKKQQLEELDKLAQATFYDMFGDPVSNEKGWEIRNLGEISNLKSGQFVKASDIESNESNESFPCFGGNGLRGFTKTITHNGEFVLIGRQGALCGNVKIAKGEFHATEHAVVCTPLVNYETLWFYYILKTLNLNKYATGAAQPGLAVGKLEKIDIPFSPLLIQNKFARQIESIENQKSLINQSIGDVQQLFGYTMDKYFN